MATFTVKIQNPIINSEVMQIETESFELAVTEAAYLSKLHGLATVRDNSSNREFARFRYGVAVELNEQQS